MQQVSFTRMDEGTRNDYALLAEIEAEEAKGYADRVLGWLEAMDFDSGYRITRLEHCLQAATRAHRAGEDEETVVMTLLHDVGDVLSPANHSEAAAAVLRPFVSDKNHWIVKHHGLFQGYYYFHHYDRDRNARDRYKDHEWFRATAAWCEIYDQVSFDPDYEWETLEFFAPMVRRVLAEPRTHA